MYSVLYLGSDGALLEGDKGTAGRAECSRILQHEAAVKMKCSGQVTSIVLVCRSAIHHEKLKADKFRGENLVCTNRKTQQVLDPLGDVSVWFREDCLEEVVLE